MSEEDFQSLDEDMPQDELDDEEDGMIDDGIRFFTLTVPATSKEVELEQPPIDAVIRVTLITFGETVKKNSRSVLLCKSIDTDTFSPLCVLYSESSESISVDLRFDGPASFKVKGRNPSTITLNGFLEPRGKNMDDIASVNSEERRLMENMRVEEEAAERKEEINQAEKEDSSVEVQEKPPQKPKKAKNKKNKKKSQKNKKQNEESKQEQTQKPGSKKKKNKKQSPNGGSDNNNNNDKAKDNNNQVSSLSPGKKRKLNETPEAEVEKKISENVKQTNKSSKKKKKALQPLGNGIMYRDLKVGHGKTIEEGDTIKVKYVGQLEDQSVFDKCLSSAGFEFTIGSEDIIKGWSQGLKGATVGTKRKIRVPPNLAYGKKGSLPRIPPNASLTFTVEVLSAQ